MNYRAEIEEIKYLLYTRQITYYQAKEKAQPIIDEMNIKGKEIAKKYLIPKLFKKYKTSLDGISVVEVEERMEEYGKNIIEKKI